jgi:hypothetical protein
VSRKNLEMIAELIREQHDTDITAQDLFEIQEFLWLRSWSAIEPLSSSGDLEHLNTVEIDLRYDVVKVIGFIAGAVLGALFLPALGLAAGWFAGALIGGAIGYRLAGLFDGGNAASAPTKPAAQTLFQFSGVGGLVTLGDPIPKIYGNASNNPDGGVYLHDPGQIYSKIYGQQGSRYIKHLVVLGVGRLGEVNHAGLLLDDKPLNDFITGDVIVESSPGLHEQVALGGIDEYCQATTVSANAFVSLSSAMTIGGGAGQGYPIVTATLVSVGSAGGDAIAKTITTNAWDSGLYVAPQNVGSDYGSIAYVFGGLYRGVGLSNVLAAYGFQSGTSLDPSVLTVAAIINTTSNTWAILHAGVTIESQPLAAGLATIANSTTASLEVELRAYRSYPDTYIQLIINQVEVYRGLAPSNVDVLANHRPTMLLYGGGNGVITPRLGFAVPSANELAPGLGTRFQVSAPGLAKAKSAQSYRSSSAGFTEFSLVAKSTSGWVEFSAPIWIMDRSGFSSALLGERVDFGGAVYSSFRASVTTSKPVNSVDLVLQSAVWAKDGNGNDVGHGQAFRIVVIDGAMNSYEVGRFIITSVEEKTRVSSIGITNLPLAIYTFRLIPLARMEITAPISSLGDQENRSIINTGVLIGGNQINLLVEVSDAVAVAALPGWLEATGKATKSEDRGPSIQLTHVNEIVSSPTPPTYGGYTTGSTQALASDRLQNTPTYSWDIRKGAVVRQYLAYGTTLINANPNRITIAQSTLLPGLLAVGDQVRVLGYGTRVITGVLDLRSVECAPYVCPISTVAGSAVITLAAADYPEILIGMPLSSVSTPADSVVIARLGNNQILIGDQWERKRVATQSVSVTGSFNLPLTQTTGEEAVFFSMGSSNYFPDLYVDRLINPVDGLGNSVDQDHFIHYPSIVYCRKYCVRNKFFYDGIFSTGTFEAWAIATAPSSLLYCTEINGQFALVAQEGATRNPFIFNDSNTSKYVEPGVDWQQEIINTLLVKYQDKKGKEKQIKIQTTAVNTGTEEEISQNITLQGVTSKQQAIEVGTNALKSIKLQNYTNQFDTDIEKGLYCLQGDIVRTQHTTTEHQTQDNGFVLLAEPATNQQLSTIRSITIKAIASGYLVTDEPHRLHPTATDALAITGNNVVANNNQYAPGSWLYVDPTSLILTPAQGTPGTGGTLAVRRNTYDQIITLSEAITLTPQHRISIAHKDRSTEENKIITSLGGGRYQVSGVEQAIAPGDAWILSTIGIKEKYWRITSMKPDLKTNTVSLTGVLWDDGVLSADGVVVIG